jgi:hypothetical protein
VWVEDPLDVALNVVKAAFEATDRVLEAGVSPSGSRKFPNTGPLFAQWSLILARAAREDALGWVRSLGTHVALAHWIAIGALASLAWFPQTEGRAANLDIISIYRYPFIFYIYIA